MRPDALPASENLAAMPEPARTMPSPDSLSTFENPKPDRDYRIDIVIPEFTCLCPMTGQPDFATLRLQYVPDVRCVELKSLKLYIHSYRDVGAFHEAVTNRMLDDLAEKLDPRHIRLTAEFNVRGGIYTTVVAERKQPGWNPGPLVQLPGEGAGKRPD